MKQQTAKPRPVKKPGKGPGPRELEARRVREEALAARLFCTMTVTAKSHVKTGDG